MPINSPTVPGVVKVVSKYDTPKTTRMTVNWWRKKSGKDGEDTFLKSTATILAFGQVDAEKGDKLDVTDARLTIEESETWMMGKKGDASTNRPAIFPTFLVDAANVKVVEGPRSYKELRGGERQHSTKAAPAKDAEVDYPATDKDEDTPF